MTAFHEEINRRSFVASGDLSGLYARVVDLISNANLKVGVAAADGGYGVLMNKPKHGEDASVAVEGPVPVRVGAAVQAGDFAVSAASGWAISAATSIQVASGTILVNKTVLGRFLTGAASGMLATLDVDPFVKFG